MRLPCLPPLLLAARALAATGERFEVAPMPALLVGWTPLNGSELGYVRFTVVLSGVQAWMAVGLSPSDGVGSSLMVGAGAVVGQAVSLSVPVSTQEYLLSAASTAGVIPWKNTGPSAASVTQCIAGACPGSAGQCASIASCNTALDCTSQSIAAGNSSTSAFQDCTKPLINNTASLGAYLQTTGCYFSSCSGPTALQPTAYISRTSYARTNSPLTTTMSFVAMGAIAGQPCPVGPVTLIVAYGTSDSLGYHGGNRAAVIVDLSTGLPVAVASPQWVVVHSALVVAGLGALVPLSSVLRSLKRPGGTSVLGLGVIVAIIGVLTAAPYVNDFGSRPHSILGALALAQVLIQWLIVGVRPSHVSADDARGWFHVMAFLSLFTCGLVVAATLTGYLLSSSGIVTPPPGSIIGVVVVIAGFAIAFACTLFVHWRARQVSEADQQKVALASTNPKFNAENGGEDSLAVNVMPMTLVFRAVTLHAPGRKGVKGKVILQGCSGFCAPRTLTAIMGPSGAGKSSLLDLLADRIRLSSEDTPDVTVNGIPLAHSKSFARHSGYVLQNDVLHQYLTVYETLLYTARLVLGGADDKAQYDCVMRVVAQLGLGHAVNTKVGGPDVRGLSGGERRRVSIGLQIVKSPSLLFLDEPTSGLDAHTSAKLVSSLRDLANEGRTVVATIHQPSAALFEQFDRLVLLSAGKTVFSGTRTAAERFFAQIGRPVPARWNPADWYLTVVDVVREAEQVPSGGAAQEAPSYMSPVIPHGRKNPPSASALRRSVAISGRVDVAVLRDRIHKYYQMHNPDKLRSQPEIVDEVTQYAMRKGLDELNKHLIKQYNAPLPDESAQPINVEPCSLTELDGFVQAFDTSGFKAELDARSNRSVDGGVEEALGSDDRGAKIWEQVPILTGRAALLAFRDPQSLKFQVIQNLIFGVVIGSLYSNLGNYQAKAYALSMAMVIILGIIAMVTVALGTAVAFNDKLVFKRESADRLYAPVAHFISRLTVGLPLNVAIAACLILPSYWWIGLSPDPSRFVFFLLVNCVLIFLFDGVVGAVVFLANDITTAFGIGNTYEAIAIFMSGIFIQGTQIPSYWIWLYYLSPFNYAFAAVAVNQFQNTDSAWWLDEVGIVWRDKWGNLAVLLAMGIGWRILGLFLCYRKAGM